MEIRLVQNAFDPQREESAFAAGRSDIGALVSFVGICRGHHQGNPVSQLYLDHYPRFTDKEIGRIVGEVAARCDCPDILVVQRVGVIAPGEAIVLVAALSVHRANAFEAVRLLMDYLKTDAPLWKKQTGGGGTRWIEPTECDHAARALAEAETP